MLGSLRSYREYTWKVVAAVSAMGAAPDLGTSELVRRPWVCVTKKTGEKLSPAASLCQGDTYTAWLFPGQWYLCYAGEM